MSREDEATRLRRELEAVPRGERLDYLAGLPPAEQAVFRRLLPRDDLRKLNNHIDRLAREAAKPSYEKWMAEARAGRATTPDAMVEALLEIKDKLRPPDAIWIDRITETASAGSFSKRQEQVIRGIYSKYFV